MTSTILQQEVKIWHAKRKENVTYNKKGQAIEIDPLITEMLKTEDRAFKNLPMDIFNINYS